MDSPVLIAGPAPKPAWVEIVRSFAYKLNMGAYGRDYESRDFFCSQKARCAPEHAEAVAADLADFCQQQVMAEVKSYVQQITNRRKTA